MGVSLPDRRWRGSGVELRRTQIFSVFQVYDEFDFQVPVRTEGDCLRALSVAVCCGKMRGKV